MKKFSDIMFSELTAEEIRNLPEQQYLAWFGRPTRKEFEAIKGFMLLRAIAIAIFALLVLKQFGTSNALALAFPLAMYEVAYYNLRKEKAEADYQLALIRYKSRAEELDSEA